MGNKPAESIGIRLRDIPAGVRAAFLCCLAAGYIAHLFAFTNIIPNADGLSRIADPQQMTISGRWFLHYATMWNGYVQSPAVIGFFSVFFMALAAAFTVSLLKIRNPVFGVLCGILMIVFPPVAHTYLYLYTASAYFFGILLSAAGVWVTSRFRYGFLPGAVLLACAVGTYQAYLAAAAALSVIAVLLYVLEEGHDGKGSVLYALRYLAFGLLGLVLYFGILRVFLWAKDLTLIDYKGISSMAGKLSPGEILPLLIPAYRKCLSFFFRPGGYASYTTVFSAIVNALIVLLAAAAFFVLAARVKLWKRAGAAVIAVLLILVFPLCLNLNVFMGDEKDILRYAFVFAYILALVLTDRAAACPVSADRAEGAHASEDPANRSPQGIGAAWKACTIMCCLLIGIFYFNIDNIAYTAAATAHRATESFATRLVERVEAAPGYENGMEVVIIGSFPDAVYHSDIAVFDLTEAPQDSVLTLNKQVYYYLNDWLNVPWQEPDEETMQAVSDSSVFQAMPLYPDDGSVVVTDGRVIVKLAAQYRPKQPYEIQYENRR